MSDHTELMDRIKKHEGFVNKIYKDSLGKATIGYGHLVLADEQWEDGKEYPLYKLEISDKSHPYFTGKQNLVDSAGRIEKFNRKYKLSDKKNKD